MTTPKPIKVEALSHFMLYIIFENGEEKIYDIKRMLEYNFYKNLRKEEIFRTVKISDISLEWITGEDIAPEEIYYNSIPKTK